MLRGYNITALLKGKTSLSPHTRVNREQMSRRKRSLPTTFDFWENEVGLSTARDQDECGSCWSFSSVIHLFSYYLIISLSDSDRCLIRFESDRN